MYERNKEKYGHGDVVSAVDNKVAHLKKSLSHIERQMGCLIFLQRNSSMIMKTKINRIYILICIGIWLIPCYDFHNSTLYIANSSSSSLTILIIEETRA